MTDDRTDNYRETAIKASIPAKKISLELSPRCETANERRFDLDKYGNYPIRFWDGETKVGVAAPL